MTLACLSPLPRNSAPPTSTVYHRTDVKIDGCEGCATRRAPLLRTLSISFTTMPVNFTFGESSQLPRWQAEPTWHRGRMTISASGPYFLVFEAKSALARTFSQPCQISTAISALMLIPSASWLRGQASHGRCRALRSAPVPVFGLCRSFPRDIRPRIHGRQRPGYDPGAWSIDRGCL